MVVRIVRRKRDAVACEVALVLYAVRQVGEREGDRLLHPLELLQPDVHRVQRGSNGEDADDNAEDQRELLLPWGRSNEVASLQILAGIASVRRRNAHHSADGDGKRAKRRRGPPLHQEDCGGGHQRRNRHPRNGRRGRADDADDSRRDSDEEEAEDNDQQRGGEVRNRANVRAWDRLELEEEEHEHDQQAAAAEDHDRRQIMLRARRPRRSQLCSTFLQPLRQRAEDRRQCANQRDESRRRNRARAHRPHISSPQIGGQHIFHRDGARIERAGEVRAEEVDRRHQNQPGEDAAGQHDRRDTRSDDVSHAEILRCTVGTDGGAFEQMLRAKVGIELRRVGPQAEEPVVLEERVDAAESETEKDARGEAAAAFARDQNVGAGRAFGIEQRAVLLDDELAAQWDHEQNAEPAAKER